MPSNSNFSPAMSDLTLSPRSGPSPTSASPAIMTESPTMATATSANLAAIQAPVQAQAQASPKNSLHAAAVTNHGLQQDLPHQPRSTSTSMASATPHARRKSVLLNLQMHDPTVPGPGEMAHSPSSSRRASINFHSPQTQMQMHSPDPHHGRTPSLGEIHQELEVEQEAQVNRLLGMIRQQQQDLLRLQALQSQSGAAVAADESAISSGPCPVASSATVPLSRSASISLGAASSVPRSSFDMARADLHTRSSRTPSIDASPRLRAGSTNAAAADTGAGSGSGSGSGSGEHAFGIAARDDTAFYQAETQIMMRENQMLRHRIRELEKQVADMNASPTSVHDPCRHSSLAQIHSASTEN